MNALETYRRRLASLGYSPSTARSLAAACGRLAAECATVTPRENALGRDCRLARAARTALAEGVPSAIVDDVLATHASAPVSPVAPAPAPAGPTAAERLERAGWRRYDGREVLLPRTATFWVPPGERTDSDYGALREEVALQQVRARGAGRRIA
jgi:hypothetical protein